MRDWNKFAWKKGDVLKNTAYEERVIFDGFLNDDYTYFKGKHPLDCSNKLNITYHEECNCFTGNYRLESTDAAQTYINTIEERLGGKLNLETLEIEKAQPEFKDGDILYAEKDEEHVPVILILKITKKGLFYYAGLALGNYILCDYNGLGHVSNTKFRFATEEEKKKLFDILVIEGKAWDAEKKEIIDLKPKVELKPFDKVLGRNEKDDVWEAELFSHYREESQYPFRCIGFSRKYCIPYNEETAHLLGTTDDWEGGEQ